MDANGHIVWVSLTVLERGQEVYRFYGTASEVRVTGEKADITPSHLALGGICNPTRDGKTTTVRRGIGAGLVLTRDYQGNVWAEIRSKKPITSMRTQRELAGRTCIFHVDTMRAKLAAALTNGYDERALRQMLETSMETFYFGSESPERLRDKKPRCAIEVRYDSAAVEIIRAFVEVGPKLLLASHWQLTGI